MERVDNAVNRDQAAVVPQVGSYKAASELQPASVHLASASCKLSW